jgi:hypothetical protein
MRSRDVIMGNKASQASNPQVMHRAAAFNVHPVALHQR